MKYFETMFLGIRIESKWAPSFKDMPNKSIAIVAKKINQQPFARTFSSR